MKRIISLLLAFVMLVLLSSCAEKKPAEEEINIVPQVERMRSICELGVIDCYYHNVAKCFEENAEGVLWWKKDKLFWVEYDAVVSYGIDFAKLDMTISDDVITIFIPQAKLQSCTIGDSNSFNYIVAEDSAKITAEDERDAISKAQEDLKEKAANDTALIDQAQQRAQNLLNEYVESINELGGKSYKVQFRVVQDDGKTEKEDTEE